jgi:hypothetical protein
MWMEVVRIKLPLLFFPIAFAGTWQLHPIQWKKVFRFFIVLTAAGCCWSLWQYGINVASINESYLRAKSIPTPFSNDHVRFSWVVAVLAAGCLYVGWYWKTNRGFTVGLGIFFVTYLHVLAARTGLFCFYFFVVCWGIYLLLTSKKKGLALLLIAALIVLPIIAWLVIPTFKNRVSYILYDVSFIKSNRYLPGGNDGNRVQSFKAGWAILLDNPLGVGAGDVKMETESWYNLHIPGMLTTDRLLPSSEWLMYGAFAGWAGLILFTAVMLLPLTMLFREHRQGWFILNSMAAAGFLFDIGLEVQFGVFAYIFVILCCWKYYHLLNASATHP